MPASVPATSTEPAAPPAVSVVVPAYNAAAFLAETVASVLAQTYADFELLIVDDGSRDDTAAIAASLAAGDPARVRLLQHPGGANRGVSATRNLGIRAARGKWVAFLDADDVWHPGKLAHQIPFMESMPDCALSYTQAVILREGHGERFMPGVEELGTVLPPEPRVVLLHIILVLVNYIFSTVVVRRDALLEIGGFAENLPFQSEDRIMVAMVAARHRLARCPEVLCSYRAHSASYTAKVVARRLPPAIFFDMQVYIMRWLIREDLHEDWARQIAYNILPVSAVRAVSCSLNPRVQVIVIKDFAQAVWCFPMIPFNMSIILVKFFFKPGAWRRLGDLLARTALFRAIGLGRRETAPDRAGGDA